MMICVLIRNIYHSNMHPNYKDLPYAMICVLIRTSAICNDMCPN